jgi:hypothetical protein
MKNFCSISDKNYLNKILTLYNSLVESQKESFILHVLCLDDFTYTFFNEKKYAFINTIHVNAIENQDFLLKYFRYNNVPSQEAISNAGVQNKDPRYIQYCWALAPYICWYLIENIKVESILYIDSLIRALELLDTE